MISHIVKSAYRLDVGRILKRLKYGNMKDKGNAFAYNREVKYKIAFSFVQVIVPVVFAAVIITMFSILLNETESMRLIPNSIACGALLVCLFLQRQGKPIAAVITLMALLLVTGVVGMVLNGGVYAPIFSGTLVILVLVGWFFSSRTALLFFLIILALGFVIATGNENGWWREHPLPPPYSLYIYMVTYQIVVVAAVVIGNRMLHQSIYKLSERENLLNTIQESIGVGLITIGLNGELVRMNAAATALLSHGNSDKESPLEVVVFQEDDKKGKTISEVIRTVPPSEETRVKIVRDHGACWIAVSHYPHMSNETICGTIITLRDITEKVTLEQQLSQSAKMEIMGQLASGVVHDLKNNLGGILGFIELLKERDELELPRYLGMIQIAGKNAVNLTDKLLSFSHKTSRDRERFDMVSTLRNAVFILERYPSKNIEILLHEDATESVILGFESDVQSVFMNLGINAYHAMPNGGVLEFRTRNTFLSEKECALPSFSLTPGQYLEVQVIDSGTGISNNVKSRIFEPFFTTKERGKGTGLGLASVFHIVKNHNGAVQVSSELGKGTTFTVLFPIVPTAQDG